MLKNFFLRTLHCWVGQYEVTKKKSPEIEKIDRLGAAPATAPTSRCRVAPGVPRVTVALVPTSRLRAAPGPCRATLGVPRVTAAPVPTSWLRAALGPARVPWASAPTARRRAAPGALRVPAAPG
jgi:hypothetical protein